MAQPVTVENDHVRMDVWPQFGGKVSSIVDLADGFELVFNFPAELPSGPQYDTRYANSWYGGWDECFPAIAPSVYDRHPYTGTAVPDHGELWGLPTTSVPAKDGITTVWHGLRFGYRLTRKLTLDGPTIRAQYTLVNLAPFEFQFVWAQHALLSVASPIELELPVGSGGDATFRLSHDADGNEYNAPFHWPAAGDGIDLSDPQSLPPRRAWKAYSESPIAAPATVLYPARGRRLRIAYSSETGVPAHWGVWVNTGGWAGQRHAAVEPTTGRFDQIDRAIRDRSAAVLPASGRCEWQVEWTLE